MRILTVFCLLLVPVELSAQGGAGNEFRNGLDDIEDIWTSPGSFNRSDIPGVLMVVGPSAAALLVDQPIQDWVRSHQSSVVVKILKPFREGQLINHLGNAGYIEAASLLAIAAGAIFDSRDVRDAGRGCLSSTLANTVVRHVLGAPIGRARPSTGKGPFAFEPALRTPWEYHSLPNGHGANAIACPAFLAHRFDLGVAEPILYSLGTGVALSRILDEAHWTSDTILGFGFGYAVGKDVARGQLARKRVPTQGLQLSLSLSRRF